MADGPSVEGSVDRQRGGYEIMWIRRYLRAPEARPVRQNRWSTMNTTITGRIETSEPVITDTCSSGTRAVWPFHSYRPSVIGKSDSFCSITIGRKKLFQIPTNWNRKMVT